MRLVETKTYEIDMADAEREQLLIIAQKLSEIGQLFLNCQIEIDDDVYSSADLFNARDILIGLVTDEVEIGY